MSASLDELGRRIERVALDPAGIEEQLLFRVARPLLAITGWRAKVRYVALKALLPTLAAALLPGGEALGAARAAHLAAVEELAANVEAVERAAIVRRKPPVGHAAWLRRVWEMLVSIDRSLATVERGLQAKDALRCAARADVVGLLPPLGLRANGGAKDATGETRETESASQVSAAESPFIADVATRDPVPAADADARIVELELAAIDHLLAGARAERSMLGRRRRMLVAARQRLLDVSAALPLDREGARARASYIAKEIVRIDRLETIGLSADVGLAHQARQAIDRGDPRRLLAALAALDAAAIAVGDSDVSRVTGTAIAKMWDGADPSSPDAVEASLQASASELLGADIVEAVQDQVASVHATARQGVASGGDKAQKIAANQSLMYFAGADVELLRATVAVDGCFEVGGALTAVRIVEEDRYLTQVRHPTPDLVLVPAHDVHDVPDAIISDPRTVLMDLATGRLLARRFVREEVKRRTRVIARSEVRVYVLDGSGSMRGPRARVRDALLVAEIATLIARLKAPGEIRSTLLFRFFDTELGPLTRVDSIASARVAIREIVGTMRGGGTNIQKALLASLEQVEVARELDPELSRAQIVLVTDGDAPLDEDAVVAARAALGGLPIGVSVIALGEHNPALRGLVARQRARGEPSFYHFLDDAQLEVIVSGALDVDGALHLPPASARDPQTVARELESELGALVEELRTIERERDIAALERLDDEVRARREAGSDAGPDARADRPASSEGERARIEALNRDRASLAARFARWFPAASLAPGASAQPARGTQERDEVDATVCALSAVAEVVMLVGGPELARRAEAIELLERLLPDAQLTPARYREILRDWADAVAPALCAVHAAASPA